MESKVAIITGASSGIGEQTAIDLAKHNISVMLAARREEKLQKIVNQIVAHGGTASYYVTDVTSYDQMRKLADETIKQFGKIDILVNNAGIMTISLFNKLRVKEWNTMIDVNIKGVLHGIAAVLPYMESRNEGHIINVSSVAGHEITPPRSLYSATKFAVRTITEGLRKELKPEQNIRTTIISPGAVTTDLLNNISDQDVIDMIEQEGSIENALEVQEISQAIIYAIEQPPSVSVNEIIIRPTAQRR